MTTEDTARPPGAEWAAVVADDPSLAASVRARFAANRHHVLGTVRRDGAPRLSGTEVVVDDRAVSLGMMPGSRKLADVRRDPRVELHSAPTDEELVDGDAKLAGRLVEVPPRSADEPDGTFFELAVELVSLVRVERDELVLRVWRPGHGTSETRRQ